MSKIDRLIVNYCPKPPNRGTNRPPVALHGRRWYTVGVWSTSGQAVFLLHQIRAPNPTAAPDKPHGMRGAPVSGGRT